MKKRIAVCCISSVLCHILLKPRTSGCRGKEEVMLNNVYSEKTSENKDRGGINWYWDPRTGANVTQEVLNVYSELHQTIKV